MFLALDCQEPAGATVLYNSWDVDMEHEKLQDANIKIYESQAWPTRVTLCTTMDLAVKYNEIYKLRIKELNHPSQANDLKAVQRRCGFLATRAAQNWSWCWKMLETWTESRWRGYFLRIASNGLVLRRDEICLD